MPKITEEDLEPIQAKLFKKDLDYLRSIFKGNIGVNAAIRNLVRSYVNHSRAQAATVIDRSSEADITIPDEVWDQLKEDVL